MPAAGWRPIRATTADGWVVDHFALLNSATDPDTGVAPAFFPTLRSPHVRSTSDDASDAADGGDKGPDATATERDAKPEPARTAGAASCREGGAAPPPRLTAAQRRRRRKKKRKRRRAANAAQQPQCHPLITPQQRGTLAWIASAHSALLAACGRRCCGPRPHHQGHASQSPAGPDHRPLKRRREPEGMNDW